MSDSFQPNPSAKVAESLKSTMPEDPDDLGGAQKAATLLIALGTETASKVLKQLDDEAVERVSVEIAKMRNASSEVVEAVLAEYQDMKMAQDYIAQGGISFAKEALDSALGSRRADEIMMRVEAAMEVSAFHLLQTVETAQLTNFLQNEHPQTAALIIAHLNSRKAADILQELPSENQSEITYRLATMGKTSPELLSDIEDVIRDQLGSVFGAELSVTGGVEQVAEILNQAARSVERTVLDGLRDRSEDLASDVKNLMFVFDDLEDISGRDLQRLLMEVEQRDLAYALKAASDTLKDKVFDNVSERVASGLEEEMELMGQVRVRDVEEAQRAILEHAQELEAREEIVLARVSEEDMI